MRIRWTPRRLLLAAGLAFLAGSLMFCSPVYVARLGIEEAKILGRREPIEDVIAAATTGARTREKLELVRAARLFAEKTLGLDVGDSYTTYTEVERDTLLLLVSASRKDAFELATWWFPIVGRVPYKGFFDPDAALAAARRLERKGYDTYVRPAGAFSTLGWFNDPLLSTALYDDDVALAATVIHEVTHNTVYVPGQAAFNESFASFVGDVGALEFFCGLEGETGPRCSRARAAWSDARLFGAALQRLIAALEAVYGRADLTSHQKIAARERVFAAWRDDYARDVVPRLEVSFQRAHEGELNNARLVGWRLYYDRLDLFDDVYRRSGRPLKEVVAAMVTAAESSPDTPFDAVAALAFDTGSLWTQHSRAADPGAEPGPHDH